MVWWGLDEAPRAGAGPHYRGLYRQAVGWLAEGAGIWQRWWVAGKLGRASLP